MRAAALGPRMDKAGKFYINSMVSSDSVALGELDETRHVVAFPAI